MATVPHSPPAPAAADAVPALEFSVAGAAAVQYAAVPTLCFRLEISAPSGRAIRSVLLDVQLQIAARRRGYGPDAQERLAELFGTPDRWSTTLRTLPWTRTTLVVPPFTGATVIDLPVTCTYDLEVTAARYLAALSEGEVPLELLFSGTLFYAAEAGSLQAARIAWDREADYRLPVAVWREAIDRHFPDAAWLRLGRASFDRLCAYKARHACTSFDVALDRLLDAEEAP